MASALEQIQALQDKILASEKLIREYQLSNNAGVADASGYTGWIDYANKNCKTKSASSYIAGNNQEFFSYENAACKLGVNKVLYNNSRIATEQANVAAWKAQVAQLSKSPEVQIAIQNATLAQAAEQKRKTFLIIGGIVIAVIIVGAFIYFKWIKK